MIKSLLQSSDEDEQNDFNINFSRSLLEKEELEVFASPEEGASEPITSGDKANLPKSPEKSQTQAKYQQVVAFSFFSLLKLRAVTVGGFNVKAGLTQVDKERVERIINEANNKSLFRIKGEKRKTRIESRFV